LNQVNDYLGRNDVRVKKQKKDQNKPGRDVPKETNEKEEKKIESRKIGGKATVASLITNPVAVTTQGVE